MNNEDIRLRIKDILNEFIPSGFYDDNKNIRELGIDSLIFIQIVVKIEEGLNIKFPEELLFVDDIGNIENLNIIVKKIIEENANDE